jgi:hypothetical protein
MDAFSVQDLFAVGIGLDIAGGYLVVRGLLLNDVELRRLAGTYVGMSYGELVARIEDRIDARVGLMSLIAGFFLQAVAYVLTLGGAAVGEPSVLRGVLAGALAVLGAGTVLLAWRRLRKPAMKRDIVAVSCVDPKNRVKLAQPLRGVLVPLGEEAGFARSPNESDEAYALRVFGVTELFPGEEY